MSKRDEIRQAATRLFWERGYEATSPRLIQDESGAGQGSFYHHFKSKADLAADVLEDVSAAMIGDARELLAGRGSPLARLRRYLALPRDGSRGCKMGRFANETSIADDRLRVPISRYFLEVESLVEAALQEAIDIGELADGVDAKKVSAALVAVVQGAFILSRATGDTKQMKRSLAGARALLDGLES